MQRIVGNEREGRGVKSRQKFYLCSKAANEASRHNAKDQKE